MNAGRDLEASRELLVVILVGTTEEVWMENRTMSRAQEHVTSIKVLRGVVQIQRLRRGMGRVDK